LINSGIILLLVNANLQFSPINFLPIYNIYTDISADWYSDIGWTITQSMIIMASMPIALISGFYGMKVAYRYLDAGFYCCKKQSDIKTKKVTQKQYKDLWSGNGYFMYAQYSSCSVQIYVSFIYGVACPIIFLITFFSLTILYISERLNLAYWHPRPPMYGDAMNK
jgi:hypothetical protein